jgi:hypothetical protein
MDNVISVNLKKEIEKHSNIVLLGLLIINFIIRLVIFFNTNLFRFSDWGGYLDAIERINAGEKVHLSPGMATYLNSYIGYFFKYVLGSFNLYFIFNCLIGTLTTFIIYKIMRHLKASKVSSLLAVVLLSFYTEFMCFSSIFYTPIIMVFLLSLTMLFTLKFINNKKYSLLYFVIIVIIISLSLFFKVELKYVYGVYFILGIICIKNNFKMALKLLLLAIIIFGTNNIIGKNTKNPILTQPSRGISSFIVFQAHTWFGGDGGKMQIVYPEQQERYDKRFKEFCSENDIINPTHKDKVEFQDTYVKKFIVNHPFSWIHLQFHKFFWEYGVLPEANSFKILMTGLTKKHTILTAVIVVFPVILYIILFIISFDIRRLIYAIKKRPEIQFLGILFLYYIVATVFYFAYSERYRIPVMVCFWIPLLAFNLTNFKFKSFFQEKKELIVKLLILLLFIGNWSYEAYVIGIKHKDRYFKTIEAVEKYNNGPLELDLLNELKNR